MRRRAINPDARLVQPFVYTQQQLPTHRPCILYIRQSTTRQLKRNKQSYELQDSDMRRRLVQGYGWQDNDKSIIKIDSDQGKSGTKRRDERTGLNLLYTLLEQDAADTVAAFDVSRLYRVTSKAEIGTFCDMVMDLWVPIVTFSRIYWPTKADNDQLEADLRAAGAFIDEIIKGKLIAAKLRHIEYDFSYGGHATPIGYQVVGMGDDEADRKFYQEYRPHAELVRQLFRRFKALNNLPLLYRELVHTDFRFPPLEQGIAARVAMKPDSDGSYPLRNRKTIISILTNRAYIGWYEYGGVLVSKTAWDPIVPLDDFTFAYETLTGTTIDGEPLEERKPRERRYGGTSALLDGVLHSGAASVYVIEDRYTVRPGTNGFPWTELAVNVEALDNAFGTAMVAVLGALELVKRRGTHHELNERITALQREQEKQATDFTKALARIDLEISKAETAQLISKEQEDWQGYTDNTKQLVQLRKDRVAIEAKAQQADKEASELAECDNLIECASQQWSSMSVSKQKRLIRLLGVEANLCELSPHFVQLDVWLGLLMNKHLTLCLYRARGSRIFWTEEENSTLAALFPTASKEEVMAALPRFSWVSICARGYAQLGVRRTATNRDTLAYADLQMMEQYGARVDRPTWVIQQAAPDRNMIGHLLAANPGQCLFVTHGSGCHPFYLSPSHQALLRDDPGY